MSHSDEIPDPLENLAVKAAGGDTDAFRLLAGRLAPRVHHLAWRILADSQLAADAVQEFLIKLVEVLPRFDPGRPFWPWAQRIASRVAIDLARHGKAWLKVPLAAAPEMAGPAQDRPDHLLEVHEERSRLSSLAGELTGRQRAVFVLRDLEDWTTAEIAEHLDLTESTVRVHLARARARLRQGLIDSKNQGDRPC